MQREPTLNTRDPLTQILKQKTSPDARRYAHYEIEQLIHLWRKDGDPTSLSAQFYPIRVVALLETFTRAWIRVMVDESRTMAQHAIRLVDHLKPDYQLILGVTARTVTFGDIVAHAVSVSNLGHIMSHFQILCDCELRTLLATAADESQLEVEGEESRPIIADFDEVCAHVFETL